jgi:hypothetical protein
MFRCGSVFRAGERRADVWGDMWRHNGSSMDIVGWRLE